MAALLQAEEEAQVNSLEYYLGFSARVRELRIRLRTLVSELKDSGKSIAAYGAAAKGAILLNFAEIGRESLDWCADRNNHKHGRFMPGVHVEVVPTERVLRDQPDYLLILPWNFKDEIIGQQQEYVSNGGKFIIPVPSPQVV